MTSNQPCQRCPAATVRYERHSPGVTICVCTGCGKQWTVRQPVPAKPK